MWDIILLSFTDLPCWLIKGKQQIARNVVFTSFPFMNYSTQGDCWYSYWGFSAFSLRWIASYWFPLCELSSFKKSSRCMLEKTLESPLDSKEIKSVHPKGNPPWIVIGRTDAETEAPIPWPPDAKSRLIGKDPDARKDWRQEEKGTTEDEMLDGITDSMDMNLSKLRDGEGQGSLACCSPWFCKESDVTATEQQRQIGEDSWESLGLQGDPTSPS